MYKIAFVSYGDEDVGSFRLRVKAIIQGLEEKGYTVTLNTNLEEADIIVFQKSNLQLLFPLFVKFRRQKNKIIVFDLDDYLDDAYRFFVTYADIVITPSPFLQAHYLSLNKNVFLVDNVLEIDNLNVPLVDYDLVRQKKVWYGNRANLFALHQIGIEDVVTITLKGDIEWQRETIDTNLRQFDLLLLPQSSDYNGLAKSNCRMLKALYLGLPVLAQNIPAYAKLSKKLGYPQYMLVNDGENWQNKCEDLKTGKLNFCFDFDTARRIILKNYGLEKIISDWLCAVCSDIKNVKKQSVGKRWKMELSLFTNRFFKWMFYVKKLENGIVKMRVCGILFKLYRN